MNSFDFSNVLLFHFTTTTSNLGLFLQQMPEACWLKGPTGELIEMIRFDKGGLHYAERWSQERGSLSPPTTSPQRSRWCPSKTTFKNMSHMLPDHQVVPLVRTQEGTLDLGERVGAEVTPGSLLLVFFVLDFLIIRQQSSHNYPDAGARALIH